MSSKMIGAAGAVLLIAAVAGFLLLGGDDEAQATETDGAFLTAMTPHHESAVEMAEIAERRAEHPEIAQLANEIITAQESEIEEMDEIHQMLFDEPLSEGVHGTLGLEEHVMGMDADVTSLEQAEPFDRAFIDEMIPHHQGAIEMARIELADGEDEQARALAEAIIVAQTREIEQMNEWRTQWYGAPSPAGGAPAEGEAVPPHAEAGH